MKAIILLVSMAVIITSCKKSTIAPPAGFMQNQGELMGYNERMCPEPSCGGMVIHIDNDTSKNASPYYLYNGTLPKLNISDTVKFPINVTLTWKRDTGVYGSFNYIVISKIKLR